MSLNGSLYSSKLYFLSHTLKTGAEIQNPTHLNIHQEALSWEAEAKQSFWTMEMATKERKKGDLIDGYLYFMYITYVCLAFVQSSAEIVYTHKCDTCLSRRI